MVSPMKVLFVLPNVQVGGVERVRLALIEYLTSRGVECCLALRRRRGELLHRALSLCPVVELAPKGIHQFVPALARLLQREQPTHVISAFPDVGTLCWLAIRISRSDACWIHSVHNTLAGGAASRSGLLGSLHYWLENRMAAFDYRRADAIVTVSDGVRDEIIHAYGIAPSRVTTIHNPVVPDDELAKPRRSTSPSQPLKIVAIGRLVRLKGFDVLIQAMSMVHGAWYLDIWGDGPERKHLAGLVEQHGLQNKIALRGYTESPFDIMRGADIYVMSSRHEGLPATLIEALASQCQIVSTDCPHGPHEILQGGKLGKLVPPDDARALAGAIARVVAGEISFAPELLLVRAKDFTRATCGARWENLLRNVGGGSNAAPSAE